MAIVISKYVGGDYDILLDGDVIGNISVDRETRMWSLRLPHYLTRVEWHFTLAAAKHWANVYTLNGTLPNLDQRDFEADKLIMGMQRRSN